MTSQQIRKAFLDFFASKQHKIVPSAPLVLKDDPTLMFTNSGMVQFKDYFLGNKIPPALRIADTQKCLRVSGKHNDLEDVGFDGTHHTLFEMLGNWSFGDYFKPEAIAWSWELLTEVLKLPKDRLYATVFGGDTKEGLEPDDEAKQLWLKFLPENHILYGNKKDNFWEMGAQGPCGPCSEIHFDMRSDSERAKTAGETLVNQDDPQVVEIWNNVFMQFERKADGHLEPLPSKHVDTGMGFERLCMILQNKNYTYDTDIFEPTIHWLEQETGKKYTGSYDRTAKTDVAMRVVADHIRAVAFAIADGCLPSSGGAGYVIRRILRRAVRYYYSFLDVREPLLHKLIPALAENFKNVFPELIAQEDFVKKVILEEEKAFLRTLELGLKKIDHLISDFGFRIPENQLSASEIADPKSEILDGVTAFELFDTFGFPIDLTRLIMSELGITVDEAGFEKALAEQKNRSRSDAEKQTGDWTILDETPNVEFVGYDHLQIEKTHVLKYRTVKDKKGEQYQIVLSRTPFYAEGGGQVGDTGVMYFEGEKIQVLDTKKENETIFHYVDKLPHFVEDKTVRSIVDSPRRKLIENNHSATHLLHAALRKVLGKHVAQKGSLVNENYLRFDFSHFEKVTDEQIAKIETIVNAKIRENVARTSDVITIEQARESGAMMLFGEKYGDRVRMVTIDPAFSKELCGGCHVHTTGQIGLFKITSEESSATGVRRITAVTADAAEKYVSEQLNELNAVKATLKNPKSIVERINALQEENKNLQKQLEVLMLEKASSLQKELRTQFKNINGVQTLITMLPIHDANSIKMLAYNLEKEIGVSVFIVFGTVNDDKPQLTVRISENLVKERGLNAGTIVRELAKEIKGGGGGQAFFATAGGTDASGLENALEKAKLKI